MPFDFTTYKHYTINYVNFFNQLNSKKILNDSSIQTEYLLYWIKILNDDDKFITNQLSTQESIFYMRLQLQSQREVFQTEINNAGNKILLHFRVSYANEVIARYKNKSQKIPVNEFVKRNSEFKWNPVSTNVDCYSTCNDPIIIVPFFNLQHKYLVIDGNHRLTYKVKHSIDEIEAIIISEHTVIEFSLFSSGFDKHLYIMNNEIDRMSYLTNYENANALNLIQKSYFKDGVFKF